MNTYEELQMETIVFDAEDVITTSIQGKPGDIILPPAGSNS